MGWRKRTDEEIAAALAQLDATVAALDERIGGRDWCEPEVQELRAQRQVAARQAWKLRHADEIKTYHRDYNRCLKTNGPGYRRRKATPVHRRRVTQEQAEAAGALAVATLEAGQVSRHGCRRCGGPLIPDLDGVGCLWCGCVIYEREEATG